MVAALMLRIVQSYAAQTAAIGAAILTVDALNMMLVALLVFLVLRQVMPIAASLAGGASLNTYSLISRSASTGARTAVRFGTPVAALAKPYVAKTAGVAFRGARNVIREGVIRPSQVLASNWRNRRR